MVPSWPPRRLSKMISPPAVQPDHRNPSIFGGKHLLLKTSVIGAAIRQCVHILIVDQGPQHGRQHTGYRPRKEYDTAVNSPPFKLYIQQQCQDHSQYQLSRNLRQNPFQRHSQRPVKDTVRKKVLKIVQPHKSLGSKNRYGIMPFFIRLTFLLDVMFLSSRSRCIFIL